MMMMMIIIIIIVIIMTADTLQLHLSSNIIY